MAVISQGSACPSCPIACWMAVVLVSLFTLGRRMPARSSWNDRSSIGQMGLLL